MIAFNEDQLSALTEIVNMGVGQAADVLNQVVGSHVALTVPSLKVVRKGDVQNELPIKPDESLSCVDLGFAGAVSGTSSLVFPTTSAATLVQTLLGESGPADLDSEKIGTLTEVGNMVLNGIMGSISNLTEQSLDYTVPTYVEGPLAKLLDGEDDSNIVCLVALTEFGIETLGVIGNVLLFLELQHVTLLLERLGVSSDPVAEPHPDEAAQA